MRFALFFFALTAARAPKMSPKYPATSVTVLYALYVYPRHEKTANPALGRFQTENNGNRFAKIAFSMS